MQFSFVYEVLCYLQTICHSPADAFYKRLQGYFCIRRINLYAVFCIGGCKHMCFLDGTLFIKVKADYSHKK